MLVVRPSSTTAPAAPAAALVRTFFHGQLVGARVLRASRRAADAVFIVGGTKSAHAPLPADGLAPAHELLRATAAGAHVQPAPGMSAATVAPGSCRPVDPELWDDDRAFALPPGAALALVCGAVRFEIEPCAGDDPLLARLPPPAWLPGGAEALSLAASAGLLLPLVALLLALPRDQNLPGPRMRIAARLPAAAPLPPAPARGTGDEGEPRGEAFARAAPGREGPAGGARPARSVRRLAKSAGAPSAAPTHEPPLLGVLRAAASADGAVGSIFSVGSSAIENETAILDGLRAGGGGLAHAGPGPGTGQSGAGGDERTASLGPLETIGRGVRPGDRVVGLRGGASLNTRTPRPLPAVAISTAGADVAGGLDRELIRRTIRLHLNEVKFCYERGLARDPALAGRLTVRFIIGRDGTVRAAATEPGSTLGDATVGACVSAAVRRWRFPAPQGSGLVEARYPFVFSTAGGG